MDVAYDLEGAVKASSVNEDALLEAIRNGELRMRRVGAKGVILRGDLVMWLNTLPDYYENTAPVEIPLTQTRLSLTGS